MIVKTGRDEYHIHTIGREIDLVLSGQALTDRLRVTGYWSEDQLADLINMGVGDETPRPKGEYR